MKFHLKPRYKQAAGILMAGCIAFGACNGFPRCAPLESTRIVERADHERMAASAILACRNFNDLKTNLKTFSLHLKTLAGKKDAKALAGLCKALHHKMIEIMDTTRMENGKDGYVDDLIFLGRLFEEQKTMDTKMAVVFLSLPRLYERAVILPWDRGLLENIKLNTESAFLRMLEKNGFGELTGAINTYWYKNDGTPPAEKEEEIFFRKFSELY